MDKLGIRLCRRRVELVSDKPGCLRSLLDLISCIPLSSNGTFHLHRLHPEEFRLPPASCLWCDVNYPMEPWELESSLALRQLDRLGQDKIDYLTLESVQQQTSGNFYYYLSIISFNLQHFS